MSVFTWAGIDTGTELICIVAGVQRSDYSSNTAGREEHLRYVGFLHSLENMEFDLGILHEMRSKKITAFSHVYPLIFKWTCHAKFTFCTFCTSIWVSTASKTNSNFFLKKKKTPRCFLFLFYFNGTMYIYMH